MARPARVIPGLTMTLVGTAFKMKIVNDGTQINLEKKAPYWFENDGRSLQLAPDNTKNVNFQFII